MEIEGIGGYGLEKVKCGTGIAGVSGRAHPLSSLPAPPNFAPLDSCCYLAARTLGGAAWSDSGTRTRSASGLPRFGGARSPARPRLCVGPQVPEWPRPCAPGPASPEPQIGRLGRGLRRWRSLGPGSPSPRGDGRNALREAGTALSSEEQRGSPPTPLLPSGDPHAAPAAAGRWRAGTLRLGSPACPAPRPKTRERARACAAANRCSWALSTPNSNG